MDSKPIWHNPGWITAIVGLVSAFLTLPDVVGSYLTKQQDIELAKQETEAARLGNLDSKQDQEFKVIQNTLAQQGPERVFVLRYLAHTLDDQNARLWAEKEVSRLDDLSARQEELDKAKQSLDLKRQELEKQQDSNSERTEQLRQELIGLEKILDEQNAEIIQIQSQAGIKGTQVSSTVFVVHKKVDHESEVNTVAINFGGYGALCNFNEDDLCLRTLAISPPNTFDVIDLAEESSDLGFIDGVTVYDSNIFDSQVPYQCSLLLLGDIQKFRCVRDSQMDSQH